MCVCVVDREGEGVPFMVEYDNGFGVMISWATI